MTWFGYTGFIGAASVGCGLGFIGCGQVELAVAVLSLWVGLTGFAMSGAFLTIIEHAPRFVFLNFLYHL